MIAVADEDQRIAFFGKLHSFDVDLGDQGAGGVNYTETALFAGVADLGGDAVGAVNNALTVGDFVHGIDKNGTLALEFFYHKAVVDDFFTHVDGRTKGLERNADDIDGAHHPGAESSGLQKKQVFLALVFRALYFLAL